MITMPYQATICAYYSKDKLQTLESLVKRADIEYPLPQVVTPMGNEIDGGFFIGPSDDYSDVPNFTQLVNLGTDDKPKIVLDGRPYMRQDQRNGTYRTTAENDYGFQCARLALTLRMLSGDKQLFRRLGDVPAKTFIRWVTMTLASRYNLPLEHQLPLMIVSAYYYFGMMDSEVATNPEERVQLAPIIARLTGASVNQVMDFADRLGPLQNGNDLAMALSTQTGTIRMGELKFSDLYTLMASSFVGINARENVGVALEHIPTFIAMVYTALGERSYRKTVLFARAERSGRASDLKQFTDLVYRQIAEQFK